VPSPLIVSHAVIARARKIRLLFGIKRNYPLVVADPDSKARLIKVVSIALLNSFLITNSFVPFKPSEDIVWMMRLLTPSLECFLFSYMELGMAFEKPRYPERADCSGGIVGSAAES